mmetsp:Transcript_74366/g.230664  ORF Transcript_74366/g.230664 Transcript_74366/m.230664 type:complete len:264 (-) Transcript_74366:194-985(-)
MAWRLRRLDLVPCPTVALHGRMVLHPLCPRACGLDANPLVCRPLCEVPANRATRVQGVPVPAATGMVVVPEYDSATTRRHLKPMLARGHRWVPCALALPRVGSTALIHAADGLAMLGKDGLAALLHVIQVPKDRGHPILVAEVAVLPYLALVWVELQFHPIHVAVVVLALVVPKQLDCLVVRRWHPREIRNPFIKLGDDWRKIVLQPCLRRGAELRVLCVLFDVRALQDTLGAMQALCVPNAHDLLGLLLSNEVAHLEDHRPQ